jgi:hypothetical protein
VEFAGEVYEQPDPTDGEWTGGAEWTTTSGGGHTGHRGFMKRGGRVRLRRMRRGGRMRRR